MGLQFGEPCLLPNQPAFLAGRLVVQGHGGHACQLADSHGGVGSPHVLVTQRLQHGRGIGPLLDALLGELAFGFGHGKRLARNHPAGEPGLTLFLQVLRKSRSR